MFFSKSNVLRSSAASPARKFCHSPISKISEEVVSPDADEKGKKSDAPVLCAQCGGLLRPKKRDDGCLGSFMYMKSRGMIRRWESRFFFHDGSTEVRFYADRPGVGLDALNEKAAKMLGVDDSKAAKYMGSRIAKKRRSSGKSFLRTFSKVREKLTSDKGGSPTTPKSDALETTKLLGVIDLRDTETASCALRRISPLIIAMRRSCTSFIYGILFDLFTCSARRLTLI